MMSKIKVYIGWALLLAVMVLCYGLALTNSKSLTSREQSCMLYKKTDFLNGKEASEMQERNQEIEEPFNFTLWGSKKQQEICFQEYGRKKNAEIFFICGNSSLLFPGESSLDEADQEGCLLSGDLAYELFGSRDAEGQKLLYDSKEYTIKGILQQARQIMVIQADGKTENIMDAAALWIPKGRLASLAAADFEQLYGAADLKLNLNAVLSWGRFFVSLLPFCMTVLLAYAAAKKIISFRQVPFQCFMFSAAAIVFILFCLWLGEYRQGLSFPFTPARWSDFQYWKETFQELVKGFWNFIVIEKLEPERIVIENLLLTLKYMCFSILVFILFVRRFNCRKEWEVLFYSSVCMIAAFLAVMHTGANSRMIVSSTSLWLMPSWYIVGSYLLGKVSKN